MTSEILQKIETHLQWLGYKSEWSPREDEGSEFLICRTEAPAKPNWIILEFAGVAVMRATYTNGAAQRLKRQELIEIANELNDTITPLKWCIDKDGDIRIDVPIVYYEKVSFGQFMDSVDTFLRIGLENERMAALLASD